MGRSKVRKRDCQGQAALHEKFWCKSSGQQQAVLRPSPLNTNSQGRRETAQWRRHTGALETPEGFIFSVKVPQVITHEKVLDDCDADLKEFLDTMGILGPKLGPIVFQFPFFNRGVFS